jgi:CubicO group peptidase (beta-lactamase class C family)
MSSRLTAGVDRQRLERLRTTFEDQVARGRLPGAVMHVERHGERVWSCHVGLQDPQRNTPMRADSIFRIYSMTKPIVSVATMMLVEEGRVLLRDPVAQHLPEWAGARRGSGRLSVQRAMTVHDLLRHTAGLTYEFHAPSAVRRRYLRAGLGARTRTNAERSEELARLPLMHEPGTIWDYSRATDVLGRLVEVLTGRTLGEHLRLAIFEPLGMVDTAFNLAAAQHDRIAEPLAHDAVTGAPNAVFDARLPAVLESGGGGLLSTAADYATFLRMLLGGGQLGGVRLLGRQTVEFMTADHLGALPRDGTLLPPGHGFGLGFAVRTAVGEHTEPGSVGSFGWSGAGGTAFFVDPKEALLAVLMVQAPGQLDDARERFRQLVYAAIVD